MFLGPGQNLLKPTLWNKALPAQSGSTGFIVHVCEQNAQQNYTARVAPSAEIVMFMLSTWKEHVAMIRQLFDVYPIYAWCCCWYSIVETVIIQNLNGTFSNIQDKDKVFHELPDVKLISGHSSGHAKDDASFLNRKPTVRIHTVVVLYLRTVIIQHSWLQDFSIHACVKQFLHVLTSICALSKNGRNQSNH